jgi:hypothetical protein
LEGYKLPLYSNCVFVIMKLFFNYAYFLSSNLQKTTLKFLKIRYFLRKRYIYVRSVFYIFKKKSILQFMTCYFFKKGIWKKYEFVFFYNISKKIIAKGGTMTSIEKLRPS